MDQLQGKLKDIVLNVKTPQIIKTLAIPWPCIQTSFKAWCTQLDAEMTAEGGIEFETGNRKHSSSPQWENLRGKIKMKANEFYEDSHKNEGIFMNNWAAFGYKNIKELPSACTSGIDFAFFGFPSVKDDITFWLSSTDAHTPCHFDTYGCNIVVQVYGKKSWMLFPPDAKLTAIRIPYEESSVYCTETFFSPEKNNSYHEIEESCFSCTLSPGDVLIVPPKWWHYVETNCPSLSVNAWIPIETDTASQIEECIVRILIKNLITGDGLCYSSDILNPNELDLLDEEHDLYEILKYLSAQKGKDVELNRYNYLSEEQRAIVLNEFIGQICEVPKLTKDQFREVLKKRSERFDPSIPSTSQDMTRDTVKKFLINALCEPNIIRQIAAKFLNKINKY